MQSQAVPFAPKIALERHSMPLAAQSDLKDPNVAAFNGQDRGRKCRHRHTTQEWETIKDYFTFLYLQEGNTLEDARREMKFKYSFEASVRQYKNKIKEWGLEKHFKATDLRILAKKRDKRARERGVGTTFLVRGVTLDDERLERFSKRETAKPDDHISPCAVTPAGVNYYTPQFLTGDASPDGQLDSILTSQIDHETQSIDSLPQTSVLGTQSLDRWAPFISQTRHHYHTIASTTIIRVSFERILDFKEQDLATDRQPHQNSEHGMICRGSFSDEGTATRLLWQARNLAVELAKTTLHAEEDQELMTRASHSSKLSQIFYWVPPQSSESLSTSKTKLFLENVKNSSLCQSLLGFKSRAMQQWLGDWQLMTSEEGSRMEGLGCLCFGDPSVPYPEMEILTILAIFEETDPTMKSSLLRICLWVDPTQERRDCCYCHSKGMILDFMNSDGAVTINVPLVGANNQGHIFDWAHFQDSYQPTIERGNYTWKELAYHFQGTAQTMHICSGHETTSVDSGVHIVEDLDTRFARERRPDGKICYEMFDSYPLDTTSWFCSVSGGIYSTRMENWDPGWHSGLFDNNIVFERRSVS